MIRTGTHLKLVSEDMEPDEEDSSLAENDLGNEEERTASRVEPIGAPVVSEETTRRLEDRIAASEERSVLRLETAMARIDGRLEAIVTAISVQVSAAGSAKADLQTFKADMQTALHDLSTRVDQAQGSTRSWGQWIIGSIIAVAIASFGLAVGLKQVWIGGVQAGQTSYAPASHPTANSTK